MDRQKILSEYKQLRATAIRLSSSMVRQLKPDDHKSAAAELGLLNGRYLDLGDEDQAGVLCDVAIFDIRHDGLNSIERFLTDSPPPAGSPEERYLLAAKEAFFTIVTVVRADPGLGVWVQGFDSPEPLFMVDINLSVSVSPGDAFAIRLVPIADDWYMGSGATLPVDQSSLLQMTTELLEMTGRSTGQNDGPLMSTFVLRHCIAAGATERIAYRHIENADLKTSPWRRGVEPKTGRNEPCPCGSGRKYKKCCG